MAMIVLAFAIGVVAGANLGKIYDFFHALYVKYIAKT